MGLKKDFETFCDNLILANKSDMETTAGEIAKKLNNIYYKLDAEKSEHLYIVGSVGRETAVKGSSDLDIIFDLPAEVFKKFDNYESKGQSALLQEVKKYLKERYPNTDLRGDGQVVVIDFTNYTVELVPGFKQSDESFKYPDTNSGGSWKKTNPIPEQVECSNFNDETNGNFINICHMLRAWKNKKGFKFGGLLIDTLAYNFLKKNESYQKIGFDSYLDMMKDVFKYLKDLDKNQSYWLALGSNQQVNNCDNGEFIDKADDAYNDIKDLTVDTEKLNKKLRKIFGTSFPKQEAVIKESKSYNQFSKFIYKDTEQFIEDLMPVDIRFTLELECKVTQSGWRDQLLSHILRNKDVLRINKSLDFYISYTDTPEPYNIYWKVKNEGDVAKEKNMIRGQIERTNKSHKTEQTSFRGSHFVECYLVKNGVCVAKGRINVPISNM